ncbi:flavin reductase [Tritrichomonas foetus]|uniref:Flavin reductase n=1 Tax=Tritrichomonas foetus TaxID=1144522 RepID=A0A1J4JB68_9EUKA|nr:flavin reductase [Tritrichomonas foetus]|eukprot:OHS96422.1 flavin reductase [Tritrichomonas foetus]
MSQTLPFAQLHDKALEIMSKGCFLNSFAEGKFNTMTIGWGSIGWMWGIPEFTVMVRRTRYTRELMEKNPFFTVSLPYQRDMSKALGICGTKSGRDCDKMALAGLKTKPAKKVSVPIIDGTGMHFECEVVYKQDMDSSLLAPELQKKWYSNNDYHTMYYGKIVDAYIE